MMQDTTAAATELRIHSLAEEIRHGSGAARLGLVDLHSSISCCSEGHRNAVSSMQRPDSLPSRRVELRFELVDVSHEFIVETLGAIVDQILDRLASREVQS